MNFIRMFKKPNSKKTREKPEENIDFDELERNLLEKLGSIKMEINKQSAIVRENFITNQKVALHALKRKKHYEKKYDQLNYQLSRIRMQRRIKIMLAGKY